MALMVKCSACHKKVSVKNSVCKCGNDLREDKNKLYYIVYVLNGKHVWEAAGHSYKLAKELELKKRVDVIDKKIGIVNRQLKNMSFAEFIDNHFSPHYMMKNKSFEKEKRRFKIVREYLGSIPIKNLSEFDIDQFFKYLFAERKISKSTINRYIATVKRMLNYAVELNIIAVNPAKHLRQMFVDNIRVKCLTEEQIEKLLEASKENRNKKLYYIIQIALRTGMRLSEILSLKASDIHLTERYIFVNQTNTKNSKQRHIPINDTLYDCFIEFFNKYNLQDDEDLFEMKSIKEAYSSTLEKSGIENFTFHDLRHTFASRLVLNSVDLYTVSELLGHSDLSVTRRYAHLNQPHLREAVAKV
ncbi:tyrosine-type recombinase/integrase [Geovibrio ferrireducens]|uniref:tyrosine-type recombinase/integrase n=1 Tax=Geovibrio ferrireducens TaxID=46201 RepID=UPI00224814FB|nr:site-specific integrase [Geovibrio ferrireducens]